ncbi:hypothetical protein HKX48_003513 [Thoreauomyces humboldtii]|nr:hypothetical protein HKX48_003513 [Thoreauomyces humboldtii]
MHTTTSKAVLTPLADAVSALIVIVSDAETDNSPMPNLTDMAIGVQSQISGLVGVGKRIEAQPSADPQLKREMPKACASVIASASLLVSSTAQLVEDPYAVSGRQDMLEAVKGILAGTGQVLSAFDDAEVRKILTTCTIITNHLKTISAGPSSPVDSQAYVQIIAQASQTIVVLAQLTNKRVAELLFLVLQTRLKAAITLLTKESPVLIGACKMSLTNPKSDQARTSRVDTCDRLLGAVKEIEEVVQFTTEDEGLAIVGATQYGKTQKVLVEELLPKVIRALASDDSAGLQMAIANHSKATGVIVQHAQDYKHQVRDAMQRKRIESICGEISNTQESMVETARKAGSLHSSKGGKHIGDSAAKAAAEEKAVALRRDIDRLNARTEQLQTAMNEAVISDAGSIIGNISDHKAQGTVAHRVHIAAKSGQSVAALADDLGAFGAEAGRLEAVVTATIDSVATADPQAAQELRIARDRAKGLSVAYSGAARLLFANPADGAAQEHYRVMSGAWEDSVKEIQKMIITQEGVFKAEEIMSGTQSGFDHHARSLAEVAKSGDIVATHEHAALLITSAQQFIAAAKREFENTDDETYRVELELKINEVQTGIPDFLSSAQFVLDSFSSSSLDAAHELSFVVQGLTARLAGLGDVIRAYKGVPGQDPLEDEESEIGIIQENVHEAATPEQSETQDFSGLSNPTSVTVAAPAPETRLRSESGTKLTRPMSLAETFGRKASLQPTVAEDAPITPSPDPQRKSVIRESVAAAEAKLKAESNGHTGDDLFGRGPAIARASGATLNVAVEPANEDVDIIEEEKPVLLSQEEAAASPIKAAAQELKVVASNYSSSNNPLVSAINSMSNSLSDLGNLHVALRTSRQPGTKRDFISSAQQITAESTNVCAAAGLLVKVSKDKRLKSQLESQVSRIETLGLQLKIVAAVKASAPTDRDQDAQLVAW